MSESSGVSVAPPGPRRYPLLGVFPSARKDPLGFFLESARTHGDVVALPFGMRRLYLLSHPDHIKYVLQEHDGLFQKGPAAARIWWAMCVTGMGATEFWGEWTVLADRVRQADDRRIRSIHDDVLR